MTLLERVKSASGREMNDDEAILILKLINYLNMNHVAIINGNFKNHAFEVSIKELERIKNEL